MLFISQYVNAMSNTHHEKSASGVDSPKITKREDRSSTGKGSTTNSGAERLIEMMTTTYHEDLPGKMLRVITYQIAREGQDN
jgi:hypothetical protein